MIYSQEDTETWRISNTMISLIAAPIQILVAS